MNNYYEATKAKKASIVRFTLLILVMVNAVLEMIGYPVIPLESGEIISAALVTIVGLWAGFKNNYLTKRGEAQAEILASRDLLKK